MIDETVQQVHLCNFVFDIAGEVVYLPQNASLPITLKAKEYEVFTVVPVKELSDGATFAPIGLIHMFNSGGAIKDLKYESQTSGMVCLRVRGCGVFGAYSSIRPQRISVDGEEIDFNYAEESRLLTLTLKPPEKELYLWNINIQL